MSGEVMRLTSTFSPWRARCWPRSAPGISSFLPLLARDHDDLDLLGLVQERHGVGDGAGGGAAAVPAHHDAVELQAGFLNVRHEDHRPAGFEQHAFVHHFVRHSFVPLGLPDHDQVEAAAQAAELVGGAGDAGADGAGLGRDAGALGGLLETGDRGARILVRFGALGFDELRRNAAHHRAGDDRLVGESDAEHMRFETLPPPKPRNRRPDRAAPSPRLTTISLIMTVNLLNELSRSTVYYVAIPLPPP